MKFLNDMKLLGMFEDFHVSLEVLLDFSIFLTGGGMKAEAV